MIIIMIIVKRVKDVDLHIFVKEKKSIEYQGLMYKREKACQEEEIEKLEQENKAREAGNRSAYSRVIQSIENYRAVHSIIRVAKQSAGVNTQK